MKIRPEILRNLEVREFEPGGIMVHEGTPSSGELFFLRSGSVEVVKENGVRVATISEPGGVIGEISLLAGVHHTATVQATTTVSCFVATDGLAFLRSCPDAMLAVGQLLAQRLSMATAFLADIKRQYEGAATSLAMLDEVLDSLTHHPAHDASELGSDRPDVAGM
jgi:CRP/FNR family cyclic AMP-dependent transcriptional regulator